MACSLPEVELCILEGADFKVAYSFYEDDGSPEDLTGATAEMQVKIVNVVTTYVGAVNGNSITFSIPNTETFIGLRGQHQAEYTKNSIVTRFLRGRVTIERNY